MEYDFALAGSTGQIGRALYNELAERGTVVNIFRGSNLERTPSARHVINAAGYTKFDDHIERYWEDNIRFAVQLSTWATQHGSFFHQLSSEAVAEYRIDPLTEEMHPRAHPKMIDYALSKVLTEQVVRSIVPPSKLSVYRCSDFVPSPGRFATDWRRNHWLTILFSAGKAGFNPGDGFPVWIATVDDVAKAIALLVTGYGTLYVPRSAYHLLGHMYPWSQFQQGAQVLPVPATPHEKLVDIVRSVIRITPPLAHCIGQRRTEHALSAMGFEWEYLEPEYWREYGEEAWAWN